MHPPPFRLDHRLSDWPECWLEICCPGCGRICVPAIRLLRAERGDMTFEALLRALRCGSCHTRPAPIYLLAGFHRRHCGGAPPDWAIELRGAPQ